MQDLKITIIQSSLHWENVDANLKMFGEKIAGIREKTDLILLPEMFSTGFTMNAKAMAQTMKGTTVTWMKKMAAQKKCVVAGSLIIKGSPSEGGGRGEAIYNRFVWMQPDGKYKTYDKRHLFRYAGEEKHYSAGKKKLIVELNGWKICPMVCYDLRFPVWCRNGPPSPRRGGNTNSKSPLRGDLGGLEYDLLLFVANWPERRNHPWKNLLMARAMENQAYVVGLNRVGNDGNNVYHSGDSAAINFKGEIISKTKAHEEAVETITFSKNELDGWRKTFPAWMDADSFSLKT